MARSQSTALQVAPRQAGGSREARRLRRSGSVPGVLYGGGEDPVSFSVPRRVLRHALASAGAVLDLDIQGAGSSPAVLKEIIRHPVSGETVHVDLLRVSLDEAIQSTAPLELIGAEDAPGVRDGGVLEHVTRELTIEALPNEIPDVITHDVSEMQIGDTLTLESLRPPQGISLLDDPETVIATLSPPRLQVESSDEIEEETGVVGERAPGASAGGDDGEDGPAGDAGSAGE
jgi:large subunit ribosomal protein L25